MTRNALTSPESASADIEAFDHQLSRFQDGRVADAVFLEHRLRHGVYGQRQDGVHMMRSKQPLGLITPDQLDAMADLTERYTAGTAHLTTRQDIQVHFIRLEETPDVMRAFHRAQGTFREACGNVVRNVTAPAVTGVWPDEPFDVTPYGLALARFLLKHPDGQGLGRKFKVHVAGTSDRRWNRAAIHDVGATAVLADGERAFEVRVGGGLGAVPHEAKVLYEALPADELLPVSLAVLRVFARLGEKKKRARARLKFLVADLGLEAFRDEVERERRSLPDDPAWRELADASDAPRHPPGRSWPQPRSRGEARWQRTAVFRQSQSGYAAVKVRIPSGDLGVAQLRGLAAIAREHSGDTLRVGVDQSVVLRFVPLDRLHAIRDELGELGLGAAGGGLLGDPITCPGADTCKLGITSPRALARELQPTLDRASDHARLEDLRVHISGCPNSCAQHQIADIGLFGAARSIEGVTAPHFMLLLGGELDGRGRGEAPGDGLAKTLIKLPARRVPQAIEALLQAFLASDAERFAGWVRQVGRAELRALLAPFRDLPSPTDAPELYQEFGRPQDFAVRRGTGECAGEVVDAVDLLLAQADQRAEATTEAWDQRAGNEEILRRAQATFAVAVQALAALDGPGSAGFCTAWYDTGRIPEGVGHTYFAALETSPEDDPDRLRRLVEECWLFVEEVHSIVGRARSPWAAK